MPKVSDAYRDERRTHVLNAARRCFLRNGFHATSMTDVYREAGVSSGVIYLYFASKDEIIAAIAAQNLDGITKAAGDLAQRFGSQGAGVVLANLLQYIRSEHERDGLASIALLTWSESLRNEVLSEHLANAFTDVRTMFTTLLRDAKPSDPLKPLGAETAASILVLILTGYVMQLATLPPGETAPIPEAVSALCPPTSITDH
jgi:AcrR family transcriptional regulator